MIKDHHFRDWIIKNKILPKLKKGFWLEPVPRDGDGIYVIWGSDEEHPLYVGETKNIRSRFGEHLRYAPFNDEIERLEFYPFKEMVEKEKRLYIEASVIGALKPKYNKNNLSGLFDERMVFTKFEGENDKWLLKG